MKILLSFVSFILIFVFTFHIFACAMTLEKYDGNNREVHDYLPIVILDSTENKPKVIRWGEYKPNIHTAYQPNNEESYPISQYNEQYLITPLAPTKYKVTLARDDYTFFSTYAVKDNKVIPLQYHMRGAGMVIPVFIIALILNMIFIRLCLNPLYKKISDKYNKNKP